MKIEEFLSRSDILVKELSEGLDTGRLDLGQVEQGILEFINLIGQTLEEMVMQRLQEPTQENRLRVNGKVAVYDGRRAARFLNRFGGQTSIPRRCYKYVDQPGGWYPLDEKLALDKCLGYSPLMSYLLASFGASEPFERGAELLSEALGFSLSGTAVQRNTEAVGERIAENPYELIPACKAQEPCEVMVVEVDGTISPQILEKQGVSGRESLKQPTEWKECNVVVIQKLQAAKEVERWTGARYGKHLGFEQYVGRAAIAMGQHVAGRVVFLADGAHTNWELQKTNFPGSVGILDFYHASEHLGDFCTLFKDQRKAPGVHHRWAHMLLEGQALQVVQEMRRKAETVGNRAEAIKQLNYFRNNLGRMDYDQYKKLGLPIGSGLVEGSCKFVVGRRFKGSGMRWKKRDNTKVLRVRLEKLNGQLHKHFTAKPQPWALFALCA